MNNENGHLFSAQNFEMLADTRWYLLKKPAVDTRLDTSWKILAVDTRLDASWKILAKRKAVSSFTTSGHLWSHTRPVPREPSKIIIIYLIMRWITARRWFISQSFIDANHDLLALQDDHSITARYLELKRQIAEMRHHRQTASLA